MIMVSVAKPSRCGSSRHESPNEAATEPQKGMRFLRARVESLLKSGDVASQRDEWLELPSRQVVNYLLSFLFNPVERMKWRAVSALGLVVNRMAEEDLESARNIMRRLMWSLNDESGGIGWGSAETMGEILAMNDTLAKEYCCILTSYVRKDCNPLENALLERGVLWGIGRLAQSKPDLLGDCGSHVVPYLASTDPIHRGFGLWALGFMGFRLSPDQLAPLLADTSIISLYENETLSSWRICDLAGRLDAKPPDGDQP
jgi:hypothetical protein